MNRQKVLMKKYLSRPENRYCADCKRPSPTWASLNLGVFVCIKCSGCHREIGVHITKIKSVELDLWPSKSLTDFAKINNEIANAFWEYDLKNYDFQRIRDNEIRLIEFIRDKYEFKRWAKPRVPDPMSLVIQGRDLVKEFMNNGEAVKMYEKSDEPELEMRSQHFGRMKNEKKGKSFGIVDREENKNINNNLNSNSEKIPTNEPNISNNNNNNIQNNKPKQEKGFGFIKRRQNNNENNNNSNSDINKNSNQTTNNIDLLGFGNEQNDINNSNQVTSQNGNNFPFDIFSIGMNQTNTNINTNKNNNFELNPNINNNVDNNSNKNNIINNNVNENKNINSNNTNSDVNKPKSGFSFIKKKNQNNNSNNFNIINNNNNLPIQNSNNSNDINDIFAQSKTPSQTQSTNKTNDETNNNNSNLNNNNNINNNNNLINIFNDDQLVDLFNIETPTSDAVLNLSKNLLNLYSEKEEDKNLNQNITNPNNNPNSSNFNVLNMNYPNININNYYPNVQQNKSKIGMMNNNYGINPMMGYNYQPQSNYMNNNFGFWYGYGMNLGGQYGNIGMNMNNGPINPGFNYQPEFYNDSKKDKDEPKPILLTNNKPFELNLGKNKEKEDPFKNLVDFK